MSDRSFSSAARPDLDISPLSSLSTPASALPPSQLQPSTSSHAANVADDSRVSSRNANRRSSLYSDQSFYSANDYRRRNKQPRVALHPENQPASFSFVCLGTGGGPLEGDCSCYLLKPADQEWQDGSIVVEGGSWLGALTDVLDQHGPDSAFYDFEFPASTPSAYLRAGLMASFSRAFLISHAHLDHILGLVLGSASLPGKRTVFGLKPTLENILDMFNGKIWPKLASWKEDEPHTMYHMRTLDNQRPFSVSETLSVLPFALSHGLNPSEPPAPPTPTYTPAQLNSNYFSKRMSLPIGAQMASFQLSRGAGLEERSRGLESIEQGSEADVAAFRRPSFNASPFFATNRAGSNGSLNPVVNKVGEPVSPRASPATGGGGGIASTSSSSSELSSTAMGGSLSSGGGQGGQGVGRGTSRRPRTAQGSERRVSPPTAWNPPPAPAAAAGGVGTRQPPRRVSIDRSPPSLDSTAFFITHKHHDKDVLFFGDVEPDCVSKSPRNRQVWSHAAERFAQGKLSAIFLECSFPRNHPTEFLYGHLSVEHLFDELRVLAMMVKRYRVRRGSFTGGKANGGGGGGGAGLPHLAPSPLGTAGIGGGGSVYDADEELRGQLEGLGVIVIHVKPALFPTFVTDEVEGSDGGSTRGELHGGEEEVQPRLDERSAPQKILDELNQEELEARLGVRFVMAEKGMRIEC